MNAIKPLGAAFDIVSGVIPLDLQTARSGDYISLKNAQGVAVVLFKGKGTAGDDPLLTFRQATTVAGGSVKDLDPTHGAVGIKTFYQKQDATALTGISNVWTRVDQAAAATVQLDATSAESEGIYVFQIEADELDVDNGFDCLVMNVGDVGGNAQLGGVLYLLYGLRFPDKPENVQDPVID
jgi:hypothetical protein